MFHHHLVALHKKLSTCITLLRRLVGSGWGAGAKTLCTADLSLVYSTTEYCAPVLCRSTHTCLIDSVLNDTFPIVLDVCVSLQQTTYPYLQASSQLSFADWEQHSLWLTINSWTQTILCMVFLSGFSDACQERLRSRCLFVPARRNLLNNFARLGIHISQ